MQNENSKSEFSKLVKSRIEYDNVLHDYYGLLEISRTFNDQMCLVVKIRAKKGLNIIIQ